MLDKSGPSAPADDMEIEQEHKKVIKARAKGKKAKESVDVDDKDT